jgi:hypothetical protein
VEKVLGGQSRGQQMAGHLWEGFIGNEKVHAGDKSSHHSEGQKWGTCKLLGVGVVEMEPQMGVPSCGSL